MKLLTQWAVTSSALILIVLAVRYLFRDRLSARLRYALWGIVLLRLLVPFQVELPAAASGALPVLASNFAPEVADMELYALRTRSTPLMEESLQAMKDNGHKAGDVLAYETDIHLIGGREVEGGTHCFVLSETGVDRYFFYTTLPKFLTALWVIGAVWVALTIFRSNRYFLGRLKYYRHELEGVEAPIPVYTAANLSSPCLFGVLRPAVYLSPGAADDPAALRHILAHELTHYAHFDHLWSLLRCLALALHWYNPLVWLAVVLSKQDGELACDEGAVARLGEEERIPYGRTLVDMVAARSLRPGDLLSCSTAMTGGESSIKRRVAQIVKQPETVKAALFTVIAVVALSAVFVFAGRGGTPDGSGTVDAFLAQVQAAQCIFVGNPGISSQSPPPPISDPDLLTQARELLAKTRPVAYLEGVGWDELSLDSNHPPEHIPQEELEHQFFIEGHTLGLYPTSERDPETADRYWLVPWNTLCLLVQWYPEREENTVEILASLPGDTISQLKALARSEEPASQARQTELEENHLATSQILAEALKTCERICFADGSAPDITDPQQLARAGEILTSGYLIDDLSQTGTDGDNETIELRGKDGQRLSSFLITNQAIRQKLHNIALNQQEELARNTARYEDFLAQAEGAVSIRIERGDGELTTITDPQQLEEARAALLSLTPLPDNVDVLTSFSEEELRHEVGSGLYAITLTDETGGTATYYINRRPMTNIDYLIFPVKDFPVENEQTECSFDRIGVLPGQASYTLLVSANVSSGRFPPPTGN